MDLSVFWQLSYGMYIIGVMDDDRPTGCVVNTVVQITSENPVIAVSLNKNNYTYQLAQKNKRLSVSVISEKTPASVIGALGYSSGREHDKFNGVQYHIADGLPVVEEFCCGYLICDVLTVQDCETHGVVLARVKDAVAVPSEQPAPPMTYRYFHEVVKGKAPKNAPTYQKETEAETPQYVCSVCGYIYEGDLMKEPTDYVCPICRAPKSAFRKK